MLSRCSTFDAWAIDASWRMHRAFLDCTPCPGHLQSAEQEECRGDDMRINGNWSSGATRPFVFSLALFLAACGGGGGGGGAPSPGAGGTPPGGTGSGGDGGSTIVSGWNPSERISNLRSNSIEMSTPSVALTSQGVGFAAWTERVFGSNCAR